MSTQHATTAPNDSLNTLAHSKWELRDDEDSRMVNCVYTEGIYIVQEGHPMTYARVFQSGNSQAVRLPKEFRLNVDQVEIFRQGNDIVLREVPVSATAVFDLLASLPSDFMSDGREDTPPQERDAF